MKGFRKLVVLGVLLVTLLFVIDSISAGKKETKKNGIENKTINRNGKKVKMTEHVKPEKSKKATSYKNAPYGGLGGESNSQTKKYKVKKGTKYTTKNSKIIEEGMAPKITKSFKKVKKYKIIENEPLENTEPRKLNEKDQKIKLPFEIPKEQALNMLKSRRNKRSLNERQHFEEFVSVHDYENNADEVNSDSTQKKYKLVEVVLEEDGEEGVDGIVDGIEENADNEEESDAFTTDQSTTYETVEIAQTETNEESPPEENNYASRYDNPGSFNSICKPIPDDPNRKGPKKLTLYVVEEEIDGKKQKRVFPEEDGISMCEVADILRENYYDGLI